MYRHTCTIDNIRAYTKINTTMHKKKCIIYAAMWLSFKRICPNTKNVFDISPNGSDIALIHSCSLSRFALTHKHNINWNGSIGRQPGNLRRGGGGEIEEECEGWREDKREREEEGCKGWKKGGQKREREEECKGWRKGGQERKREKGARDGGREGERKREKRERERERW